MSRHSHTPRDGLELAIARASKPGHPQVSRLAEALGVPPQTISKWRRKGRVPLVQVGAVAAATGLPPALIRPDLPDFFGQAEVDDALCNCVR